MARVVVAGYRSRVVALKVASSNVLLALAKFVAGSMLGSRELRAEAALSSIVREACGRACHPTEGESKIYYGS